MRRWLVGVAFILVASACGPTVRSRAEVAYDGGDFLGAVALYDRVLAEHPGDGEAHVGRARARNAAFRSILVAAHASRIAGNPEAALGELKRWFELRRDWRISPPPQLAGALATEVAAATAYVATSVERALEIGPFAAQAAFARHEATLALAGLADRAAELAAMIRTAGLAECARLSASTSAVTPYWTWLVDRACARWGGPRLAVPALPHQLAAIDVTGAVDGARGDQNARLRDAIAAAFRASVWYAPSATGGVRASLTGTIAATFSAHPIWLSAPWTESVPYTDYETSQESYEEPYTETEWYSEQVPYTNSDGTTSYRSEQKSHRVTKYRTAWRTVTNPVTRYRDEARTFDYQAIHREGRYVSDLHVSLDGVFGAVAPVLASDVTATGVDHDVTHTPSGVSPQRANLMTLAAFVERERAALRARVLAALGEHYGQQHCAAPAYTLEAAAACAFLDPKTAPRPVRDALRAALGADEPHLLHALGR